MRTFTLPQSTATATLITQPAGAESSQPTKSTLVVAFKDEAAHKLLKDAGIPGHFDSMEMPVSVEAGKSISFYRPGGSTKQMPGGSNGRYFGKTRSGSDVHVLPVRSKQVDGVYVEMKVLNPQLPLGNPDRVVTCFGVIPDITRLNLSSGVTLDSYLKTLT